MYVVVDSTEFYSNRLLEGVDIEIINAHVQRAGGAVLIPQLVIDEAVKKQRENLRDRFNRLVKELQAFVAIYQHAEPEWLPPPLNVDLEYALERYRSALDARIRELGGVIVPYDGLPLGPLVTRALECCKPFDATGREGFRDAVIWSSVVQFLSRSPRTCYLVTNNKKDFCDGDGLHPELQEDLRKSTLSPALVQVTESLSSLARRLAGDRRPGELTYTSIRPQFGLFDIREFLEEVWNDLAESFWEKSKENSARFKRAIRIRTYSTPSIISTWHDPDEIRVYAVDRAEREDCLRVRFSSLFTGESEVVLAKRGLMRRLSDPHPSLVALHAGKVLATVPIEGRVDVEVVVNPKTGDVEEWHVLRHEISPDLSQPDWA